MKTLHQVTLSLRRAQLEGARYWYAYARSCLSTANRLKSADMQARALTFCTETRRNLKLAIAETNAALGRAA